MANQLWDKVSFRCQKRCRGEGDIINSLRQWPKHPYKSKVLNHLWSIIPGIVLWNVWKKRNHRIFKNKRSPLEETWSRIHRNIQETMALQVWTKEDLPSTDNEHNILVNWQLQLPQDSLKISTSNNNCKNICYWKAPPKNSYKLNFDGASKGNPGAAEYGGILRDYEGIPIRIYFGNIGWDTNNSAELEGLWQGLLQAWNLNLQPLMVEGDSQILINMATRIQNGSLARKVASSWRLEARLSDIAQKLSNFRAISFIHTKR